MDFDLSEDQVALREAAAGLLDELASPVKVRAAAESSNAYDAVLWGAMVEQGWTGVNVPEDKGGLGFSMVEVAVFLDEVGRHAAAAPFLSTVLTLGALVESDAPEAKAYVDPILAGEAIGCVSWSRNPTSVTACPDGSGWMLSGRADPTLYAPIADIAIVVATEADGESALFGVDLKSVGQPAEESAMDVTRQLGWLNFENTPSFRLGGVQAAEDLVNRGAVGHSAEMLGGATAVLDMTVAYAKERVQFGQPIGSFQAVKHRCADMLVDVEGMRSTAYWAAWCLADGSDDRSIAASTAKTWCSDAAKRVMGSGLQVHGGIGFTWEHDLHFFLKRSQLDQVSFGDARFHRERIAALLRPKVEAGAGVV